MVGQAYHDGVELTQRIKAKRKGRKGVTEGSQADESLQELELSLIRGRTSSHRSMSGTSDALAIQLQVVTVQLARDALKDINIHLQQQVISNLKLHVQQGTPVDFAALQDVSDSAQDRCTLILMQLQQRIITAGPIENITPPPLNIQSSHNQRPLPVAPPSESSISSFYKAPSSENAPTPDTNRGYSFPAHPSRMGNGPPTPPHSPHPQSGGHNTGKSANFNQHAQPRASGAKAPQLPPVTGHKSASQNVSIGSVAAARQALSVQKASNLYGTPDSASQGLTSPYSLNQPNAQNLQSPAISPAPTPFHVRDGSKGSVDSVRAPSESSSTESQYKPLATTTEKVGFFGIRKKKVEKVPEVKENPLVDQYLAEAKVEEDRASQAGSIRRGSMTNTLGSTRDLNSTLQTFPWEQHDEDNVSILTTATTASNPNQPRKTTDQAKRSDDSLIRAQKNKSKPARAHIEVLASNRPLASINPKDLLPNETNNYAGFCKGAWRQQIGDRKKAMEDRVRPGSMYNTTKFWQCRSCKFEGRFVPTPNKKVPAFDRRVARVAEGIQFRWEFLFKSHICAKEAVGDSSKGTFGCIFCCAEGKGTYVFEGVMALMRHLDEHRERLPTGEVLYRMNCLVGRQAKMDEDFDINLVSKEGGVI
ncbi:uncharacterized protein KY384_005526 [Bacidia gigantensis]|uniref:uncharacterized protein n=1 Tax=Bacidia gigantensis TaxID=2732470 RepID=UPI001D03F5BC|nr:uncharacterized protein KY384_005526 [Bacidia gigantensis]KAG8530044.1 hypothetical protein KY384_005526 [Bacidia gigantensis]